MLRRSWVRLMSGTQIFSLSPTLVSCWSIHPLHSITELKFYHLYSLFTTHDDFDSANPSSMQDACHVWTQLNDHTLHEFFSSVDRAPAQCSGGHGLHSCRGLRFFLCPTLVSCWSIHLSYLITELKIHHLYSLIPFSVNYRFSFTFTWLRWKFL